MIDLKSSQSISFLPQRRLLLLETKSVVHISSSIYTGIPSAHPFSLSLDVPSSWKPSLTSKAGSAARFGTPASPPHPSPAMGLSLPLDCKPRGQRLPPHAQRCPARAGHRVGARGMRPALNLLSLMWTGSHCHALFPLSLLPERNREKDEP